MKILEAQNAVMTNHEVYKFLRDRKNQMNKEQPRRRGPSNYQTLAREIVQYLEVYPGPLSQKPPTYSPEAIPRLVERLHVYDLTKGEMIMIVNLRPATAPALHAIVEEIEERFDEDKQQEILDIIADTLGRFPAPEADPDAKGEGEADEDANAA